jgi:hypothetical protein
MTPYRAAAMLVACVSLMACTPSKGPSPREVVERYCALDAQGARFRGNTPQMEEIWGLLVNPDEAGYGESVVIESYRIGNTELRGANADVEVVYEELGTYASVPAAQKDRRARTVTFHLTRIDGSWKIDGLRQLPHISKSWIVAELRGKHDSGTRAGTPDPNLSVVVAEISSWRAAP